MTGTFATRYDVLPPGQLALLPALRAAREAGHVLYGGTAIALRLGHRESVDFDFFSEAALDRADLARRLPFLADAIVVQDEPETLTVLASAPDGADRPVKLSFFGGLGFGRVGEPELTAGGELLVASMDDLLGHKLKVLLQRVELKDYLDIAAILRAGQDLERGLGAARALFGRPFAPMEALRAMAYFEGGDLDRLGSADRSLLAGEAARANTVPDVPLLASRLGVTPGRATAAVVAERRPRPDATPGPGSGSASRLTRLGERLRGPGEPLEEPAPAPGPLAKNDGMGM